MINEKAVVVLIDCGATHNFISEKLVNQLNLPMGETSHYRVLLGSSTTMKGKGICSKIELVLGDWKIIDNFLPLELGGVDVVLGIQWLHSLGVMEVDWRNLTLIFYHNEQKIVIRGDPSLTKA